MLRCDGVKKSSFQYLYMQEKKFTITYYRSEYERNIAGVESNQRRFMKGNRQSTVEPVLGTLTQFMGLRKVNTVGV